VDWDAPLLLFIRNDIRDAASSTTSYLPVRRAVLLALCTQSRTPTLRAVAVAGRN
jgi:hypothetical protein